LLVGVVAGFVIIWVVATRTDIAWPWYCVIGGSANMLVSLLASRALDGKQTEWSEYSIHGQQRKFADEGLPEKDGGWYLVPGRIDRASYGLLFFFVLTIVFLYLFNAWI